MSKKKIIIHICILLAIAGAILKGVYDYFGYSNDKSIDDNKIVNDIEAESTNGLYNHKDDIDTEESVNNIDDNPEESSIDYDALGISKVTYPEDFVLKDDLKGAIEQLIIEEEFDKDDVDSPYWEDTFISKYITNSRYSFNYVDSLDEHNISREQIEYMQYSLTGVYKDFDYIGENGVDRSVCASGFADAHIVDYQYEKKENTIHLTCQYTIFHDGMSDDEEEPIYKVEVELVENPYSCFDGYSIERTADYNDAIVVDNKVHTFEAEFYMKDTSEENVYEFNHIYSNENLPYGSIISVEMKPEDKEKLEKGKVYKISFILDNNKGRKIDKVIATSIEEK